MNYTLKLTEKQCQVVQAALDFYYRIGMGKLNEIRHVAVPAPGFNPNMDEVDESLAVLKMALLGWKHTGTTHSILSPELPDEMRVACDIHDVIRQRLALDGLKPGGKPGFGVAFDPVRKKGKEPLATIEKRPSRSESEKVVVNPGWWCVANRKIKSVLGKGE